MFVIDPVISLDTEDRGYGGTREAALPDMNYKPNINDIRFQSEQSDIATEINDLFNEGLDKTEIREVLIDSGYNEAEIDKELDLFNEGEAPENLPYDDIRKYKGKSDGEIVESILNREIRAEGYPSILNLVWRSSVL